MTQIRDPAILGATLVTAINAGDLPGVVDCYESDATLELPDGSTVSGHDAIRAFYAERVAPSLRVRASRTGAHPR